MAKSIADRCDVGLIMLKPTDEDYLKLDSLLEANPNFTRPNLKISVYKNRRGSHTGIYLWANADLGTCRIEPQFCTTWRYEPINIDDIKILVEEEPPWDN